MDKTWNVKEKEESIIFLESTIFLRNRENIARSG
jgi:hypothetical protein